MLSQHGLNWDCLILGAPGSDAGRSSANRWCDTDRRPTCCRRVSKSRIKPVLQAFGQRRKEQQDQQISVPPPQPPSSEDRFNQRSLFVGGLAVLLGLAALTLWSAQSYKLPWERRKNETAQSSAEGEPVEVELAAIVDDQHTRPTILTEEDKDMEVRRLQAARVALERRLSQLSGSKDRRVGIPTPYVPQSERPWREKGYREAMAKALKAGVAIDPTADMSMQWEDEQSQQTALDMQQELDQRPITEITQEEEQLKTALEDIKDQEPSTSEDAASQEGSTTAEPSKPVYSQQGVDMADLASKRLQEAEKQKESEMQDPPEERDTGQKDPLGTEKERALVLPDLSTSAEGDKEEDLLPTPSTTTFREETATTEERTAASEGASISQTDFVRRSRKPVERREDQLRLLAAGASAPAPHKMQAGKAGEDAFFVSEALWGAMGVADGVGSWKTDGVDPSLFSRRLMEVAAAATEHGWGRRQAQGARGLLHISQIGAIDVEGTSTVCVAQMMLGRTLQIANLGDSGFRIFRNGKCIFASEVQRHSFNCPYQAGSPKLHPNTNNANDASVYELELRENDIILMATDGIYDNLWDFDLEDIVSTYLKSAVKGKGYEDGDSLNLGDAAAIALKVVGEAGKKGSDPEARTPWIAETAKEKPDLLPWNIRLRPRGGKPDDCTAVVALLQHDPKQY